MKIILKITLIGLLCLFFSCKKEFQVGFAIENNSARRLSILTQKADNSPIDSNAINTFKRLTVLTEIGKDQTPEEFIQKLSSIPLEHLEVKDLDGNAIQCDELALDCWDNIPSENDKTIRTLLLEITEESF